MPHINITFRVDARYYQPGTPGYVTWYIPRSLSNPKYPDPYVSVVNNGEQKYEAQLWIPEKVFGHLPIMMRLTMQGVHSETKQVYYELAATAVSTINEIQECTNYILYDIENNDVGSVRAVATVVPALTISIDDHKHVPIGWSDPRILQEMSERLGNETWPKHDEAIRNGVTNITYDLPPMNFKWVTLPSFRVPMWTFALEVDKYHKSSEHDLHLMFEGMYRAAIYSMNLTQEQLSTENLALQAEILCTMCLLPTRHMLYVIDNSRISLSNKGGSLGNGTNQTDEWARLCQSMFGENEGYDCEDGTDLAKKMFCLFRSLRTPLRDPYMERIRLLTHRYIPLFTIGTIETGDDYTYHAMLILLDKSYFLYRIGVASSCPIDVAPSCLLESTNYTTSCWEWKDKTLLRYDEYKSKCAFGGDMSSTHVTSNLIRPIYHHAFVCFSPDLLTEYGIARVDFKQNGKYGVEIDILMQQQRSSFECVVTRAPAGNRNHEPLKLYDLLPRVASLTNNKSGVVELNTYGVTIPPKIRSTVAPTYDFCYRYLDWNDSLYRTLISQLPKDCTYYMEVATLSLSGHQRGIRVRIWLR